MIKKFLHYIFIFICFFVASTYDVNAANLEEMAFLNRPQGNFPFTTNYDPSPYPYYGQYYLFNGTSDLPSYSIITTCATGPLTFSIANQQGNLSYMGYVDLGGSCTIRNSQYSGSVYVYYFNLISYTDAGNGNMGINYSMNVSADANYIVWAEFTSVSFSSSSDFTTALQNQTLIQNQNKINNNQTQTNEKLDDLNDNITNDNVSGVEESFSNFEDFLDDNSTITQLITLPVTLYSSILNGVSNSCIPFNLGNLYGQNLTLPCVNIGNYLGSTLWGMIDLIISGFAIYSISKKLIKVFNNFSSMKDGDVIDD